MPSEKSVGVVLYAGAAAAPVFLILHYGAGHWSLPKGHVEPGESEEQTALRELREETGISPQQIILVRGFRATITYSFKRSGKRIGKTVVFFLARARRKPVVELSFEHRAFAWLPVQKAISVITYASDKTVIKKAASFLKRRLAKSPT